MASRSFDFGKMKRSFYTTTLRDGTVLIVNMPKKKTFEKIQNLRDMDAGMGDKRAYEELISLMAEILSNNKNGKTVTEEYLNGEDYDVEEIVEYIKGYGEFVASIQNDPN